MTNKTSFSSIFAGLVAYALLGLYVSIMVHMILTVLNHTSQNNPPMEPFSDGLIYIVTTIGGLVSALVISRLTLSDPKETPVVLSQRKIQWKTFLELAYLLVWLLAGLSALVVGVIVRPEVSNTLSDIGTTWLGLAVASGFSYFGLRPPGGNTTPASPNTSAEIEL